MLAEQIQADLTAAMKARDQLTTSVLRLALAAIKEARVSGDGAHDLSDDEVLAILSREAKRRDEAAAASSRRLASRDKMASTSSSDTSWAPSPETRASLIAARARRSTEVVS